MLQRERCFTKSSMKYVTMIFMWDTLVGFVFLLTYFQKDNFVARFCDSVFTYFCSEIITFHYASVLIKTPLLRPDVN